MKYITTRDISNDMCKLSEGTIVYRYDGHTYGCISSRGIAVTMEQDVTPFFEVPEDSVKEL